MDHKRNKKGNFLKSTWRQMKIKTQDPKSMQPSKSSSKKEFYSNTNLPKEKKKNQINNIILHLKRTQYQ